MISRLFVSTYLFVLFFVFSIFTYSQISVNYPPDQIPCSYFPSNPDDFATTCTGRGLWHGYTLPQVHNTKDLGSYGGPYCYYTNKWLSRSLLRTGLTVGGQGEIPLASANEIEISQYPTHLLQSYVFDEFHFESKLMYVTPRTSILETYVVNTSEKEKRFNISVGGNVFPDIALGDKFTDGWMIKLKDFPNVLWIVRVKIQGELDFAYSNSHFELSYRMMQDLAPGDSLKLIISISQYFIGDTQQDIEITNNALNEPYSFFKKNADWWNYISGNFNNQNREYHKISQKAFQTIMINMRSNLPGFNHFTFKDGTNKNNFINTDESWVVSSALVAYDTKLALHNILSVILKQNDDGSLNKLIPISDTNKISTEIYQNPLSSWSVWNSFSINPQPEIAQNTIKILEKIHQYWYSYRDSDFNGYCEDDDGMESVKLNAMLFNEKHNLKNLYKFLHNIENEKKYDEEIKKIVSTFNYKFFNPEDLRYYDYNPTDSSWYTTNEVYGYVFWAGLASWDIARLIIENDIRPKIQNNYYKNVQLNKINDPAYFIFLIRGLISYGFNDEAQQIITDLKENIVTNFSKGNLTRYIDETKDLKIENSSYLAACVLIYLNYF